MDVPVAMRAVGLAKRFGETTALDQVDLTLPQGEIIGLVGENGAGKSTLLNILSGLTVPDAGSLEVRGSPVALSSYTDAQRHGIGRVFQEQSLIPNIPVYENLLLGHERRFASAGQLMHRREMVRLAQEMVEEVGAGIDVRRRTSELSFSERQLVEIIRACSVPVKLAGGGSPILLLDEPTASLEKGDEAVLLRLLERIRSVGTALFVSHRLGEVLSLCDRIVVLKDGRRVAETTAASSDEGTLHRLMVGRERRADHYGEDLQLDVTEAPVAFEARSLTRTGAFRDVTLEVRAGEILGIGGLLESGKTELGRCLAGIDLASAGEVRIGQAEWFTPDIRRAISLGLGYVPGERMVEGMISGFPIAWNLSLASGGDLFSTSGGLWRHRLERIRSQEIISRLRIKARSGTTTCDQLSGGNQQKVVLGRWLLRDLRVLVLDNPTRGVDAGAREEIYRLLRGLAAEGVALIVITDDLLELIGLSNRIALMRYGRISALIPADRDSKPTEETLVETMLAGGTGDTALEEAA